MNLDQGGDDPEKILESVDRVDIKPHPHPAEDSSTDINLLLRGFFWISVFLFCVLFSGYLTYGLWTRYNETPVTVTLDAKEQNTNSIVFPAVTICNLSLFSKRKVANVTRILAESGPKSEEYLVASRKLKIVKNLCSARKNFYEGLGLTYSQDEQMDYANHGDDPVIIPSDMLNFFMEDSCEELIKYCKFGGEILDCFDIFKPIITDYGRCCTFNMLPLQLLLKNRTDDKWESSSSKLVDAAEIFWNKMEINSWEKWNYNKDGIQVPPHSDRPYRQIRAGRQHGLSISLNLVSDDAYCSASKSAGVTFTLHSPLELPKVTENSSAAVHMGQEIFVEVNADVTKADDDIRDFPRGRRKCFFGSERKLDFYHPYTRGNCIGECVARAIMSNCGCTALHLPNLDNVGSNWTGACIERREQHCMAEVQSNLKDWMDEDCPNCDQLCEEIKYNHQLTIANLKPRNELIRERDKDNRSTALLHIFLEAKAVPKLRKSLYRIEDLIASTGWILGLCLGFSVLSLIELIYLLTFLPRCKDCGRLRKTVEKERSSANKCCKITRKTAQRKQISRVRNSKGVGRLVRETVPWEISMAPVGVVIANRGCV